MGRTLRWSILGASVVVLLLAVAVTFLLLGESPVTPGVETPPPDSIEFPSTGGTDEPPDPSRPTPKPNPAQPPPTPSPRPVAPGVSVPGRGGGAGRDPSSVPPTTPDLKDRFDEVDAALRDLVSGHVAFNTPERMQFRESRAIALIASPQLDAATLAGEVRERIGGDDPIAVEALRIAPLMEVQLEGAPAFAVTPLTPTRQPVSRTAPTEWRWNVTANQTGTQTLHLTINAIVMVGGERFPRSLNVLDRDIEVDITTLQRVGMFVGENWQWLAGTIVIPLALWLWTNRKGGTRKRRK